MNIGFIGTGKVGVSLGKYFKENNLNVIGVYNRSYISGKDGAEFVGVKHFINIKEIVKESDILFLTVSDNSIKEVWNTIKKLDIRNKIICHCSGALSSNIFVDIEGLNAWGYSLHPILAFNNKLTSYKEIKNSYFTLEGSEEKLSTIKSLIEQLGNKVYTISQENKTLYHCAAVFSSNFIVALSQISIDLLEECGFTDEERSVLFPLMSVSIKNIINEGTINALTGPIERCDIETVKSHLLSLKNDEKKLYTLLSNKLIEIAEIKNPHVNYNKLKTTMKE